MSETSERPVSSDWFTTRRFSLILGAMLLVSFWPVLLGNQAWFYRDYGFLGYPFAYYTQQTLLAGEFPFWNPWIHCGVPYFAQWNTMVLYPGSLIYVLFPLPWALAWFCVLHILLGGIGMFRLGRQRTNCGFAGAFAGVAFAFGGMLLGCIIYPNYLVALAWMPWLFLLLPNATAKGGRHLVWLALIGSMQMLSGAPELILMNWVLVTLLVIAPANTEAGWNWKPLAHLVSVIVLVSGLCAFQLLPFFELLGHSQRSETTGTGFWSLPAWGWINLVLPLFGSFKTIQGVHVQAGQSFLPSVYLGAITVALAVLGLLRSAHRERLVLGGFGLLVVLLSFGNEFVLYPALEAIAPVGFARFPVKALLPLIFIVPLLAAYGVASLSSVELGHAQQRPFLISVGVVVALIVAGIVWSLVAPLFESEVGHTVNNGLVRIALLLVATVLLLATAQARLRKWSRLGVITLLWLDGIVHLPVLNPTISSEAFAPNLVREYHAETFQPPPELGKGRLMLSPEAERALHTRMVPGFFEDFIGQRLAQWGNLNILDGMPKVNGAATLTPGWFNDIEVDLYSRRASTNETLLNFLGVQYVSRPQSVVQWDVRAGDQNMVESQVAKISNIEFKAGRISFQYDSPDPCEVFVAETFHPGWQASVGDSFTKVETHGHAFMSVKVPAGSGEVLLKYTDSSLFLGLFASFASLIAGGIMVWRDWLK